MFKLCVSYEAKSLDEIKALLEMNKNNQAVEVAIKEPKQDLIEDELEQKASAKEVEKPKEDTEEAAEEADFTLEDLQKLAVQANKEGNLSKVKEVLEKHGIERVSKTPQDKLALIGQELKGLI
ncbi:hypothetical protein [Facklamia hominis]|uniref:Uncharacterized protein n=1 Tax=Facklamia hominis CCUG 36813 TaxID=883111 RepID=K1LCX9_9LACT|nr:hypothetical protein [Facklamia hominis]EKB54495.1 hypothetical protein HMPREF9706_00685 [Facklamia hominis CCUG 36813]